MSPAGRGPLDRTKRAGGLFRRGPGGRFRLTMLGAPVMFVVSAGSFSGAAVAGLGVSAAMFAGMFVGTAVVAYGLTVGFSPAWDIDTNDRDDR